MSSALDTSGSVSSAASDATGAEWGIAPVPEAERGLRAFDLAVLWGDLGIGLLVLVTGALLVPGLGFFAALGAILLGSLIGSGLLAFAGAAGARHGIPTMVLFRPVLGIRGSWVPSALNALQLIGWTAVELWAMSYVANIVSREVFGLDARWLWLGCAAVVCTALSLWGPVGVTRVWLERFGAWIIAGICLVVTVLIVTASGIGDSLFKAGDGSMTFGPGLDLVIAMPVSWLPLVADYNRFGRRPRGAFGGTFAGYLIANVWLYTLGVLLVLGASADASPAGIAAGILSLFGGSIAGGLFLVGLLVGETDEAFADIYSCSVSIKNVVESVPQRALVLAVAVVGTALAAALDMERYEFFLLLIGSVFVPLFGVFIADHFVARRGGLDVSSLYRRGGPYWYTGGYRISTVVPWLAGFALYHWVAPTGPEWWLELVARVTPAAPPSWLSAAGASIPSFLCSFLLTGALVLAGRGKPESS
jgi:putative hydroxymethylpyrimidine transporter CytX